MINSEFNKEESLSVEPYGDKLIEVKKPDLFMSVYLGLSRDGKMLSRLTEFVDIVDYELL